MVDILLMMYILHETLGIMEVWYILRPSGFRRSTLRPLRHINTLPRGSRYPIFKDSGSKHHTLDGFWLLGTEPNILGTWTL